jgi:hypothetical protein
MILFVAMATTLMMAATAAAKIDINAGLGAASCPTCNIRECATLMAEDCDGQIVKDECDCCPVCLRDEDFDELFSPPPHPAPQSKSSGHNVYEYIHLPWYHRMAGTVYKSYAQFG